MPKIKSHSGVKKRFQRTGSGKIVRKKAGGRHLLTGKASNRKRRLSGNVVVDSSMTMPIKRLMPYSS
ncbi:MAG: 50S ribosomal protein L35 [Nitrospirae bacterium RIFCSPLOWO2_02_FULL_62_14]|nr:MAG: 50S ribosomal protein L35 [Nitrospirae bacterium RIFCSPLOWO2_02_FULL_62_14]OGW70285.1 MAG: 50S ribosomal protein L35 [Nitrospirae bacterium RIFCSPLOWO2_01_FULL_62_17]